MKKQVLLKIILPLYSCIINDFAGSETDFRLPTLETTT